MSITRREFINAAAFAGAGALVNPFQVGASPRSEINAMAGYELIILGTNWGFEGSLDDFCSRLKKEGYDGAELWCPQSEKDRQQLVEIFNKYNLKFGLLIGGSQVDPDEHFQYFKASLDEAVKLNPLYINCHSGRDHFSFEQNKKFIDLTAQASKSSGVLICHETHRSRILYSAPVARQFMDKIPDLRLTLDISHWCNVHESMLDDQNETVNLALSRTGHIHARIGHPEGPQVNDPRAPEWKNVVDTHLKWWDKVAEEKKKTGSRLTFLTEFGPADYMPTVPYTRQPVANQWDINVYMLKTLRARYS
jgi:sugar phosphate isomerase/epimerase